MVTLLGSTKGDLNWQGWLVELSARGRAVEVCTKRQGPRPSRTHHTQPPDAPCSWSVGAEPFVSHLKVRSLSTVDKSNAFGGADCAWKTALDEHDGLKQTDGATYDGFGYRRQLDWEFRIVARCPGNRLYVRRRFRNMEQKPARASLRIG